MFCYPACLFIGPDYTDCDTSDDGKHEVLETLDLVLKRKENKQQPSICVNSRTCCGNIRLLDLSIRA
jgi:hypothetical protein